MMPGMNPKQMQKMMQRLGMRQEEIDAFEVIIKKKDGSSLIVKEPNVIKVDMMGQKTLQITGDIVEESFIISKEDIKTVAEQAGVSEDKAKGALEKCNGDLAEAIIDLKK